MRTRGKPAAAPTKASHLLPLLLLFAGSGCAALIYQVVWLQLLQLVIGSSAVSMAVLLGTFMGGMCLGSLALPRLVGADRHPLRVYACLEIGIGAFGLALLVMMPFVNDLYASTGGGLAFRAAVAAICLLPPTALMGATLPAVARWVETTPDGISWLGFFYGGNLAGAVAGTLAAGFVLLRVYDMAVATSVAAAINVTVAAVAMRVASRTPRPSPAPATSPAASGIAVVRPVTVTHAVIALSGFTALASEVIWTRLLSLTVGATVYAFSLILAAFLSGLGLGSSVGAVLARRVESPARALGWCQLWLGLAIAWAAWLLSGWLPYATIAVPADPWIALRLDLLRCLAVVLPGAILWGASFPLALAAAAGRGQDPGRLVAGVYAANTIGAIGGSAAGVALAASVGSQHAQQILIAVALVSALMMLVPAITRPVGGRAVAIAAMILLVSAAAVRIAPVPPELIAYGRNSASWMGLTSIAFAGEGLHSFIAVSRTASGAPVYPRCRQGAGVQRGRGPPAAAAARAPLAPASRPSSQRPRHRTRRRHHGRRGRDRPRRRARHRCRDRAARTSRSRTTSPTTTIGVTDNPKVTIEIDDARHYLLTSTEKFDVITSDLVDPWVKGTAALFTEEFFHSVKDHLAPGGVVTMFVQLYLSNVESVKSEIGTFVKVFPHTLVWGNTVEGRGYDLVLTAQNEPPHLDVDALQALIDRPDHAAVAQSLRDIGIPSAVALASSYAGSGRDLTPWLADAVINRDRNLRLQYLAGLGLDLQQSAPIYADMLRYATFPTPAIVGSPASLDAIAQAMAQSRRRAAAGSGQ